MRGVRRMPQTARGLDYTVARERMLERRTDIQFMYDRLAEEEETIARRKLGSYWRTQLEAKRKIVDDYLSALAQSNPERPTLWGREARMGLYTAFNHLLRTHDDHPDFPEGAR